MPTRAITLLLLVGLTLPAKQAPAQQGAGLDSLYAGLDPRESGLAQAAVQRTLEIASSGETYRWQDGAGGSSGQVLPLRTFKIATGHYCREYREEISTRSGSASTMRTACRDDTGVWRLVGPEAQQSN